MKSNDVWLGLCREAGAVTAYSEWMYDSSSVEGSYGPIPPEFVKEFIKIDVSTGRTAVLTLGNECDTTVRRACMQDAYYINIFRKYLCQYGMLKGYLASICLVYRLSQYERVVYNVR